MTHDAPEIWDLINLVGSNLLQQNLKDSSQGINQRGGKNETEVGKDQLKDGEREEQSMKPQDTKFKGEKTRKD